MKQEQRRNIVNYENIKNLSGKSFIARRISPRKIYVLCSVFPVSSPAGKDILLCVHVCIYAYNYVCVYVYMPCTCIIHVHVFFCIQPYRNESFFSIAIISFNDMCVHLPLNTIAKHVLPLSVSRKKVLTTLRAELSTLNCDAIHVGAVWFVFSKKKKKGRKYIK